MSFHQMSGRPIEPDGQSAETEAAPIGRTDLPEETFQGSSERLDGYITYAEMRELQCKIGELLHRILDACIALAIGPRESGRN